MNNLKGTKLVVGPVHGEAEEEAGVPLVHDLQVPELKEVRHLRLPKQKIDQ